MKSTGGVEKIVVLALVGLGAPVSGQAQETRGFDVGLAVGRFVDYESAFSPRFCSHDLGVVSGKVGFWVTPRVAIEGSAAVSTGVGDEACFFPGVPAPRDGDAFRRPAFPDGFIGTSFVATHLSAMLEPLPKSTLSPRVRAGVGRLWGKELGNWFYGGGLRFRLGSHAIVADVERWNFDYEFRSELLIFRDSGAHELQSFEVIREEEKPFLIRIGWERRIR